MQIFLIFFILPELGVELDAFTAGIIGLTNLASCFICEIVSCWHPRRSTGQVEAALASGLSRWQRDAPSRAAAGDAGESLPPLVGQLCAAHQGFLRRLQPSA